MAYAAAVSLLQTLRQLQLSDDPSSNIPANHPKLQIEILHQKICSLKSFLEKNKHMESDFEIKLRDAIYEAEDTVDSHISSEAEVSLSFSLDLERVIQKISSVAEMTEKFNDLTLHRDTETSSPAGLRRSNRRRPPRTTNPMVGRYKDLIQLEHRLAMGSAMLEVVPIVGIPGIGKTTLGKYVCSSKFMEGQFGIRVWVRVSMEYRKRDVLLGLLGSMGKWGRYGIHQMTDERLTDYLSDFLKHERYLVVLDGICDIEAWNDLKKLFQDSNNGSRILITTRNSDVARSIAAGNIGEPHELHPMDVKETLALLQKTIFGTRYACPLQLQATADNIAKICRGLPLATVTIGRVLSYGSITEDYWKMVESSINTCENHVELVEAALSLSYKHLPQHLKACLLYMAVFPYDYEIPVSKLIKLWIAEGFLEWISGLETFEEMAEKCLAQLDIRGLVSLKEHIFEDRVIKTCRIGEEPFHDFFIRKAREEKFFLVINKDAYGFLEEDTTYTQQRRLCIHKNIHHLIEDLSGYNSSIASLSTARSLLYMGAQHEYRLWAWLDFKLLRVLDALNIHFPNFPSEILESVQLRYLALSYNGELPPTVCKLRKLQFLIVLYYLSTKSVGDLSYLPVEIWNMKELTHLQVMGRDLPDPPLDADLVLENLLTLSGVSTHSCTEQILQRIPNLKTLKIRIGSSLSSFIHLDVLHQLESFKCFGMYGSRVVSSPIPVFPSTLRKLTLSGCGFPWEDMSAIGALRLLKVLKLQQYAFRGSIWEAIDGEFLSLKFLLLEGMDIVHWRAGATNFPRLECLIIKECYTLMEIPSDLGDIATLQLIKVVDCSVSVMTSVQRIKEEQWELGNEDLQIELYS